MLLVLKGDVLLTKHSMGLKFVCLVPDDAIAATFKLSAIPKKDLVDRPTSPLDVRPLCVFALWRKQFSIYVMAALILSGFAVLVPACCCLVPGGLCTLPCPDELIATEEEVR